MKTRIDGTQHLSEVLPEEICSRLNMTTEEFEAEAPAAERNTRYSMLVLAVTAYEDYLAGILRSFLMTHWTASNTYNVRFIPSELPEPASIIEYIKGRAIDQKVDSLIGEKYDNRFSSIKKLIKKYGASEPQLSGLASSLASCACVARNSIVHASGYVDERAVDSLQALLPNIQTGTMLVLDEALLWKLLGALRDSARSIDVVVREAAT